MGPLFPGLRRALSGLLAASLVLLSPGLEAYAAAGRSVSMSGEVSVYAVAPAAAAILSGLGPAAALPGASRISVPGAITSAQAPAGASARAFEARAPESTLSRLALELPEFSRQGDQSKSTAEADFMERVGARGESELTVAPLGASSGHSSGLAKSKAPQRFEGYGMARPARRNLALFVKPLPGPAANLGLAMGGAIAFAGLVAVGYSALASGAALFTMMVAAGLLLDPSAVKGPPLLNPGHPVPVDSLDGEKPVEFVVMLRQTAGGGIGSDQHLSFVDVATRDGVAQYRRTMQAMMAQLGSAGLSAQDLADRGAAPIATYKRINATTLRVDASQAPALKQWLASLGHAVYDNSRREIVHPVDSDARNPVSMGENLKITRADAVHRIAVERYGEPELGFLGRLGRWITRAAAPAQPLVGVIDTGADVSHPLLKRLKGVKNATSGPAIDDNGHGSWVTSMVLNYAPWLKSVTHYKTFVDGGATLDDILKALTMAGNDGNLVISNSWGSDDGDPNGPDAQLVSKLAEEGHIMVFAAGNAGPRANTIGSPAIVQFRDSKTGAIRVLAVAASDRDRKIASFSSRGPASPMTRDDKNWPHRPDLTGVGLNTDGAWPENLDPDRVDPKLGWLKAISGTSMSTPAIAGAIALLCMMFGVTTKGEKLDAIVNAVMSALEKSGQNRDAEGEGFLNVEAAYRLLEKMFSWQRSPAE